MSITKWLSFYVFLIINAAITLGFVFSSKGKSHFVPTSLKLSYSPQSSLPLYKQQLQYLIDSWKYIALVSSSKPNTHTDDLEIKTGIFTAQLHEHLKYCQELGVARNIVAAKIGGNLILSKNIHLEPYNLEDMVDQSSTETDDVILNDTKKFVQAMIADFGACPFTIDANRAGPQKGNIRYHISHARTIEEAMYDYWKEVQYLENVDEKDISTTLLVFSNPQLFTDDITIFEDYYCKILGMCLPLL